MNTVESDQTHPEVSYLRIFFFLVVLAVIISTNWLYNDELNDTSHGAIKDLQEDKSDSYMQFWKDVGDYTGGQSFMLAPLLASPFLSRERFWFYMVA